MSIGGRTVKNIKAQKRAETKDLEARLKESNAAIYDLMYYDSITKLPNRKKLINQFNKNLETNEANNSAIFMIDIDRFHSINEIYGREVGDQLLTSIGERLQHFTQNDEGVFANGEDEFIVYHQHLSFYKTEKMGQEMVEMLSNPFTIGDHFIYITVSIGISHFPATGQCIHELLNQAEIGLYKVKRIGRNNYQVFLPQDALEVERKSRLELDLQRALERNQLHLVYQPKINLATGELIAVEALLRWKHPELGNISPGEFIPIAEESGIIRNIGYWVLYEAIRQAKEWQDMGYEISTAVNVSAIQFKDCHFAKRVLEALTAFKLPARFLIVEITESVVKNFQSAKNSIVELRNNDIRIAIDDFGTGYSSLSVLRDTKVDVVKIDKSFIDNIPQDAISSSLVSTMIQMGQNMNFDIIAEGIETLEQSNYLLENNCKYGQGYLYSKPVFPHEITAFIENHSH